MKAYPTTYKEIQFRSRIEAQWAAFFDNLGWEWFYEPIDCHRYIPDFYLPQHDKLVEVKFEKSAEKLAQYREKIELAGVERSQYAIVGCHYTVHLGLPEVPPWARSAWNRALNQVSWQPPEQKRVAPTWCEPALPTGNVAPPITSITRLPSEQEAYVDKSKIVPQWSKPQLPM